MQLTVTLSLPADARSAARMLADPAYVREKLRAGGSVEEQVDVTGEPDGAFTVTSRRAIPSDLVPAQARAYVGDRIDVRQVDAWEGPQPDGSRVGTLAVEIPGVPVRLTGRTALTATGDASCTLTYHGDLRASIPLFGAALEQAAREPVRAVLATEEQVAARWLNARTAGETARDRAADA